MTEWLALKSCDSGQGKIAGCWEHGSDNSRFVKIGKSLD
jgi:hypothetical protein